MLRYIKKRSHFFLFISLFIHVQSTITNANEKKANEANKNTAHYQLECLGGKMVQGKINQWSPRSICPEGFQVTGIQRLDLLGSHDTPTNHINDLQCDDLGCRAWCIGNPCQLQARCCSVISAPVNK